jgi:hypothetical protein
MSTRLGMADGRCFTVALSDRILNEYVAAKAGIDVRDNFAYRQALQKNPEIFINQLQNQDGACNKPLFSIK